MLGALTTLCALHHSSLFCRALLGDPKFAAALLGEHVWEQGGEHVRDKEGEYLRKRIQDSTAWEPVGKKIESMLAGVIGRGNTHNPEHDSTAPEPVNEKIESMLAGVIGRGNAHIPEQDSTASEPVDEKIESMLAGVTGRGLE